MDKLQDYQSEYPKTFWFGSSVAPFAKSLDYPEDEWESDFQKMKSLNFTAVRCYLSWDRIEQKEGILDFSSYDHLCELGTKYDIGIIMNLGGVFNSLTGVYPPQWLARKYNCTPRQPTPDEPLAHTSPRINICLDDPLYREKAFAFMETAVKRYANNRAVVGWMSWNEPALPVCYCRHTVARFIEWLRQKYHDDLGELNRIWGSEFPINYESWEEVQAPAGFGFQTGGLNAWRDWHLFTEYRLTEAMAHIRDLVHQFDTLHRPVTSNLVHNHAVYGTVSNLDIDQASRALDIVGLSFYTRAHPNDTFDPLHKAYCLSRYRSLSLDPKRRMLILETEAGPFIRQITRSQRLLNHWLAIGQNVKCFLLWIYRCRWSDNQVGNFNLMGWDGSITDRARYHGEFSASLQKHGALLNNAVPRREAAIFTPELQTILSIVTDGSVTIPNLSSASDVNAKKITPSRKGAFKLLWDMNIPTDAITETHLDELKHYKVVLMPCVENMTREWADAIGNYVANGGTVIAEAPFAFKDGNNFLTNGKAPILGLDKVFGTWTNDREVRESAPLIQLPDGDVPVFHNWHTWHNTTAQTIASYEDGSPAIVANSYGKGKAIIAGTEVFRQVIAEPQDAMSTFLQKLIADAGATPTANVAINGEPAIGRLIEVDKLQGELGTIYIVLNHNENDVDGITVDIPEDLTCFKDFFTDEPVSPSPFSLPALGVKVFYQENQ